VAAAGGDLGEKVSVEEVELVDVLDGGEKKKKQRPSISRGELDCWIAG
jgi:hypothetical protein